MLLGAIWLTNRSKSPAVALETTLLCHGVPDGQGAPLARVLAAKIRFTLAALLLCLASTARAQQPIALTSITTGLSFPLDFVQDPADLSIQFIVEQTGLIRVLDEGTLTGTPFADLSAELGETDGEQGLLGFTIDPTNTDVCFAAYTDAKQTSVWIRPPRFDVFALAM